MFCDVQVLDLCCREVISSQSRGHNQVRVLNIHQSCTHPLLLTLLHSPAGHQFKHVSCL